MASTSTLIISVALTVVGVWMLLWLIYSFLNPFFRYIPGMSRFAARGPSSSSASSSSSLGSIRGFGERSKFRRCVRALQAIEQALVKEDIAGAQRHFQKALFLDWIQHSPELVAKGSHHHLEVLNKLLIIAELEGATVRNLPKLETLFSKRAEILAAAFDARMARKRFSTKQREKGKSPPSWSTKEFDTRLRDLEKEMNQLKKDLSKEMKEALKSLKAPKDSEPEETHYH